MQLPHKLASAFRQPGREIRPSDPLGRRNENRAGVWDGRAVSPNLDRFAVGAAQFGALWIELECSEPKHLSPISRALRGF
jgi:hypothetical protein